MRICVLLLICVQVAFAPPVEKQKTTTKKPTVEDDQNLGLAYEHYLKQVIKELEKDENFVNRIRDDNQTEHKTIAENLDFVAHNIRTKLDELKRQEIDRLNKIQRLLHRKSIMENGGHPLGDPDSEADIDDGRRPHDNPPPFVPPAPGDDIFRVNMEHLDKRNPYTFEKEDLARLMKKAADDIRQNDEMRHDEFKRYEMRKEHERQARLRAMDETKRREEEARFQKEHEAAQKHEKVHYPGRKEQLEDVWEEVDGLPEDQFNPRTFFFMHDTNGDGVLDPMEVELLMTNELDKVYNNSSNSTLDENERYEEMNRMREEVFNNVDTDKDELITLDEFLAYTKTKEFSEEDDEEWKTIEDGPQFDESEFREYEKDYYDLDHQPGEVPSPVDHQPDNNQADNVSTSHPLAPVPNKL